MAAPSLSPDDLFSVKDLVAVVTGGATGIGLMITKTLEENGAKVYIMGRRLELLEKVAKEESKHGNIIPLVGDVTSKDDLLRAAERVKQETGFINLFVANAGIEGPGREGVTMGGPSPAPLADVARMMWETDQQAFSDTLGVNVVGAYYSVAAFLPLLDAGNARRNVVQTSQVIVISSIGGFNRIPFRHFAYGASKAAATHMGKQLASVLGPYNIRANIVAPGPYPSEMWYRVVPDWTPPDIRTPPLERIGTIEDMAGVVLWLTSRAGGFVSGNVVVTDGGRVSMQPSSY